MTQSRYSLPSTTAPANGNSSTWIWPAASRLRTTSSQQRGQLQLAPSAALSHRTLQRVRSSFIGKKAKPVDATDVEVMVTPSTEAEMLTKEPSSPSSQFKPVVVEADERAKLPKKPHSEDERRASVAVQSAFRGMNARKSQYDICLLYTSPSPRDQRGSRMPSSA